MASSLLDGKDGVTNGCLFAALSELRQVALAGRRVALGWRDIARDVDYIRAPFRPGF
jgi:hypothetical protein